MSIFQKSVIKKHLKNLDNNKIDKAYIKFQEFYGDKLRLVNIMQLKEENYQEGFLREIFVQTLGYTINPDKNYNLTTEYKNQKDARKADGAIISNGKAIGVIELKSTKTKNLESIKEQAFGYKNNQAGCKYVITSNFQNLRFYIDNATEYEEFNLFHLDKQQFKFLYLLLSKESIFSDMPAKLKQETKLHENDISNKLYTDYKQFKDKIFTSIVKNNAKYDKLILFKKSQKLLDRFLFVFFAEDCGLIPPNTITKIVSDWKKLDALNYYQPLYKLFKDYFSYLNKGKIIKDWGEIPAYNGGLFTPDKILDNPDFIIDDEALEKDSLKISAYDFNTEVDVNILGHIFEHSLNEIEEITAQLQGNKIDKKKSKRKKDGVFYTPKYITKYIVENTVGTLCNEKKDELQITNLLINDKLRRKDGKLNKKGKQIFEILKNYKKWLLTLKILDPACGSGAFLNQTLDFLISEHKQIDNLILELTGESLRLHETDKSILENNIFGVDINEESVEIAKLSLWLRTAQKGRELSDLSDNIKCGNSLIDKPEVAGDKAFNWKVEFKEIMDNGGFDVVLGNPPYVSANNMTFSDRKYFNNSSDYKTLKGKWDLYIPFVEKSMLLLKKSGFLVFIIPYGLLNQPFGIKLRQDILENNTLYSIVDLHNTKIFKSATVPSCIPIVRKGKNTEKKEVDILALKIEEMQYDFSIPIEKYHTTEQNMFRTENLLYFENVINKVKTVKKAKLLGDIVYISTGAEIHGKEKRDKNGKLISGYSKFDVLFKEYKPEYKPYIEGSAIEKSKKGRYSYPKIDYYLNYQPEIMRSAKFPELFDSEKIIIRRSSGKFGIIATYDETKLFNSENNINIILKINLPKNHSNYNQDRNVNLKYIIVLLNSNLLKFYYKTVYAGFIAVFPNNLKQLVFPVISKDAQQPFIAKADLMLSFSKELQIKTDKFIKRIKSNLEITKITKKLQKFYNFDFKTFISELKKQKIKLSFKDQDDWEDYFDSYKQEINELQSKINKTDKEIDEMVYQLYELTEEEIKIVENETK